MAYLPWHNPDNIVSEEVEKLFSRIKNVTLALLFLIGGPANVMNMAVFYKQDLKDRVNLCLFALSFADELYLITVMFLYGEQLHMQFTTKERFGPITTFMTNMNFTTFLAFLIVSPILSTIIAIERCLCVFNPLKFQSLIRTGTMAGIILVVCILAFGLYFIVVFKYRIGCVYDSLSGVVVTTTIEGEFYKAHRQLIDCLDIFVFGVGLPGVEIIVVTTTTIMTIVKLRQIVKWRSETTSSISPREVALTKMLVGNSILFIVCLFPVALFRFSKLILPDMSSGGRNHNFFLTGLWIAETLTYINATFSIFVYYAMGSRYRETFRALFGRKVKPVKA